MKLILLTTFLGFSYLGAYSQCEKCNMLQNDQYDFCYTNEQFDDICIQFGIGKSSFRIKSGKKPRELPLKENADLEYLIGIAKEPKLKLTAYEVLFLEKALVAWTTEKRKFGHTYTDSGLGYRINEEGAGELPVKGEKVIVHYSGYLENGTKFDSSYDRNKPFSFTLGTGQVIAGWDEGVGLLKKGTKAILRIPPNLGYGQRKIGSIPQNSTLYFEIELLEDDTPKPVKPE